MKTEIEGWLIRGFRGLNECARARQPASHAAIGEAADASLRPHRQPALQHQSSGIRSSWSTASGGGLPSHTLRAGLSLGCLLPCRHWTGPALAGGSIPAVHQQQHQQHQQPHWHSSQGWQSGGSLRGMPGPWSHSAGSSA